MSMTEHDHDHDPEATRVIQRMAQTRRDLERLTGELAAKERELAIVTTKMEALDLAYRNASASRDYYMRCCVEMRTQLSDAANLLLKGIDQAREMAHKADAPIENPIPKFLQDGPRAN